MQEPRAAASCRGAVTHARYTTPRKRLLNQLTMVGEIPMSYCSMRRIVKALGLSILSVSLATTGQVVVEPTRFHELSSLVNTISTRKVELAADLLFAVADAPKVSQDRESKLLLIKHIHDLTARSAEARRPYMSMASPTKSQGQDLFAIGVVASSLGLDGMSIKLRAMRRLQEVERFTSARIFTNIVTSPDLSHVPCTESEIYVLHPSLFEVLFKAFPRESQRILELATTIHHAQSLALAMESGAIPPPMMPIAAIKLAGLFSNARVSDRVFSTIELRMKLGAIVEKIARRIPPGEAKVLVESYVKYVGYHVSQPRCADVLNSKNEDMIEKFTLSRANRLAAIFNVAEIDADTLRRSRSRLIETSKSPVAAIHGEADREILGLAIRLKNSADHTVEQLLIDSLNRVARGTTNERCIACSLTPQFGTYLLSITLSDNLPVTRVAVDLLLKELESDRLKSQEPAIWVFFVRAVLSLLPHPDESIARVVKERLRRSNDPDIRIYLAVNDIIPFSTEYQKDFLQRSGGAMVDLK